MVALKFPVFVLVVIAGLTLSRVTVFAQATQTNPLELFSPAMGQIEPGGQQAWTFSTPNGAVRSFQVQRLTGDLDPAFSITTSSGSELIGNDDYNYPSNRDALLEAITLPRTDTYTVIISGVSDTAGEYRLTMTAGYGETSSSEDFSDTSDWKADNDALKINRSGGTLNLSLSGPDQQETAFPTNKDAPAEYYAQVDVNVSGDSGWIVGVTARQQEASSYYLLKLNESGQWQFVAHDHETDRVLRDWTPHPAIVAGNGTFSLGVLVSGGSFDFFYNSQFFGHMNDNSLNSSGKVGLSVGTHSTLTSKTDASFSNLSFTTPMLIDGKRIVPQQLIVNKPGDMAQELQRRGLIPDGGTMALTVDQSFIESRRPGVDKILLGRGTTFTNFAIGSTITWQAAAQGVTGCGLIFRSADDTHYTLAYIDQTGSYGISQRDNDIFKSGIFAEHKAIEGSKHQLLVVAREQQLLYYVDGYYSGTLNSPVVDGSVGNAVVNFDPISTSCQFADTWVWEW